MAKIGIWILGYAALAFLLFITSATTTKGPGSSVQGVVTILFFIFYVKFALEQLSPTLASRKAAILVGVTISSAGAIIAWAADLMYRLNQQLDTLALMVVMGVIAHAIIGFSVSYVVTRKMTFGNVYSKDVPSN